MTKVTLFLTTLLVFLFLIGSVQAQPYYFNVKNETYVELDSNLATVLTPNTPWESEAYDIPIGFNFNLYNESFDSISVLTDGIIVFITKCPDLQFTGPMLFANHEWFSDRALLLDPAPNTGVSKVSYLLSGVSGDRILKIEWNNVGLIDGDFWDVTNFQVWLYETGLIEIRFGHSVIDYTDPTIFNGRSGPINTLGYHIGCDPNVFEMGALLIYGSSTNPQDTILIDQPIHLQPQYWVDSIPPSGTVYQFNNSPFTNIQEKTESQDHFQIFPSVTSDNVTLVSKIDENNIQYLLYSLSGQILKSGSVWKGYQNIDISKLPEGMYLLKIYSPNHSFSKKIIKTN